MSPLSVYYVKRQIFRQVWAFLAIKEEEFFDLCVQSLWPTWQNYLIGRWQNLEKNKKQEMLHKTFAGHF
jgi:hypothetical protein